MGLWQQIVKEYNDPSAWLTAEGRVFYASDADQNDVITTQTSFANTTPSILLDVPDGTIAIPLMMRLFQTGTVAGGAVDVIMEIDNADRYNTGGTSETVLNAYTGSARANACTLYTGATANSGYGVRIFGATLGQDVSPAEGAVNEILWTPSAGLDLIAGAGAWAIYTYATGTAPTWFWTVKWAEIPEDWLS